MRQFMFVIGFLNMLLITGVGSLLLTKLSPELLSATRISWLSSPGGTIIGCFIVGVASAIPLIMFIAIDTMSFSDGEKCAEKRINRKYFLIPRN